LTKEKIMVVEAPIMAYEGDLSLFSSLFICGTYAFFFPNEENNLVGDEFKKKSFFCWKKNVCHIRAP
jgi:hypothetical protein